MREEMEGQEEAEEQAEVKVPDTPLRWIADSYYRSQRERIRVGNQISAVKRGSDTAPIPLSVELHYKRLMESEESLVQDMAGLTAKHPVMPWLSRVRGVGPVLGAKLIGLIGDISTFDTPSKLWRFCGYSVIETPCADCGGLGGGHAPDGALEYCPTCRGRGRVGARERPVKGEKLHYSIRLKTTCFLVATSFLRSGSAYRLVYDSAREYYAAQRPEWTKAHQHMAAMRKMTKIFLAHLWEEWRKAEGLPIRLPYVIEHLGHKHVFSSAAFLGKVLPPNGEPEPVVE